MKSLKNVFFGKEYGIDKQISFVGLANAGKTTLIKKLKGDESVEKNYQPTMGMNLETFKLMDKVEVVAADMGGQKSFQEPFWKPFVSKSAAVVFMFDSADEERVTEAGQALHLVLEWIPKQSVFLFLANKVDLSNALPLEDIIEKLNLNEMIRKKPHSFGVYQISVLESTNVKNALSWLADQLSKYQRTEESSD